MDPSSSSSSFLSAPNSKPSRFSTLKVFGKFGNKNKEKAPPPLPPKDPYYLNSNRSFVSISAQYARRPVPGSINPASSSVSLASSTADSDPALLSPPSSARTNKKSSFFSVKRGSDDDDSLRPTEDENISLPWNFQHNIHVDEGYSGLPPSWTVSLAEAGFTQDEIAAIYARKQSGTLTPGSFNDRPLSPPVVINPAPRSTSLPRQYSNASLRSASSSSPPPLPLNSIVGRNIQHRHRSRQNSSSSSSIALSISVDGASDLKMRSNIVLEQSRVEREPSQRSNSSFGAQRTSPLNTSAPVSLSGSPSTPPRKGYYVANATVTQSPPPAYDVSQATPMNVPTLSKTRVRADEDNEADTLNDEDRALSPENRSNSEDSGDFLSRIPLTPLTLPDIGSGLGLGNLGFDFLDMGLTDTKPQNSTLQLNTTNLSLSSQPSSSFSTSPSHLVPPVIVDDVRSNRTTFTSVFSSDSGYNGSSSLLGAPIMTTGPPASPLDPFPLSPSPPQSPSPSRPPSTIVSEEPEIPYTASTISTMRSTSTLGMSPLPDSGLFHEIQGLLAPGGMTSTRTSNASRGRKKKSRKGSGREKELTPIQRLRGYEDSDEDSGEGDEEEGNWDQVNDDLNQEDKWTSPAISESQSPTLPPASPHSTPTGHYQRSGNRVSAYRIRDRNNEPSHSEETVPGTLSPSVYVKGFDNRNSTRSSTSTISAATVTQATRVTAMGYVVQQAVATKVMVGAPAKAVPLAQQTQSALSTSPPPSSPVPSLQQAQQSVIPPSPQSSTFGGSEEEATSSRTSGSTSTSTSSSLSPISDTQTEDDQDEPDLVYYMDSPLPTQTVFDQSRAQSKQPYKGIQMLHKQHHLLTSTSDTFGGAYHDDDEPYGAVGSEEDEQELILPEEEQRTLSPLSTASSASSAFGPQQALKAPVRPTILINNNTNNVLNGPFSAPFASSGSSPFSGATTPITPNQRYRGWLSEVVEPLEEFIDESIDPREYYLDLAEVAEGESGSVYAARISDKANLARLTKLPPLIKARDVEGQSNGETMFVAIKTVPILPSGSTKLDELKKELVLLRGVMHANVLGMQALYVDVEDDSLWIRMELMHRSLADVVILCDEGLVLQERVIARFAHDTLEALQFLRSHHIAHRDIRSDNLLLNSQGVLKLTDFSNAVKLSPSSPVVSDAVGILYWQAPEVRAGLPYNAFKADIWSVGATVWELAQAAPPFADSTDLPGDRWPQLRKPEIFSPAFHDFLRLCSEPASLRPEAQELLKNSFVNNTCGRPVIGQLLQQCIAIEQLVSQREELGDEDEQGTLMS